MVCSKPIYLQLKFIYFLQANFTVSLVLENRNYFATLSLFFICHKNVTWHEIFLFCGLFLRPFCGPHYFTLYYLHNSEVGCIVLYVGLPKVWNIRAFSSSTVKFYDQSNQLRLIENVFKAFVTLTNPTGRWTIQIDNFIYKSWYLKMY